MPTSGEARPDPKARTLARGPRRYRRKVASPKQWQAIIAAKQGPCRACPPPHGNGSGFGVVEFHHIVSRQDGGDDVADNIIPLGRSCHERVTRRVESACRNLVESLSDKEYAYMVARGGEGYPERAYGVRYER